MNVISRHVLLAFSKNYRDARGPIERWWKICKKNNFYSFADLKKTFSTADLVGLCLVFNIGGGKYRLVVRVNFVAHRMWIKYILTHESYDKLKFKGGSQMPAIDQSLLNELYPLKAIHNQHDYQKAMASLEMVFDEIKGPLAEYAETLSILIDYYESNQFPIDDPENIDVLKFLMEQNNLKQKDLVGILGSKSTVSEIINGKRLLNLSHIKALSKKFNVKMSSFI